MKSYLMIRDGESFADDVRILVREHGTVGALRHRVRHSPTGMNWGYGGSGPADLARSIVWDVLGREPTAVEYQAVKWALVSPLPAEGGEITEEQVRAVLARLEAPEQTHELGGEG